MTVVEKLIMQIQEFWECNLKAIHVIKTFNLEGFCHNVIEAWCEYNFDEPNMAIKVCSQIIWLNSCVKIKGMPIQNKDALRQYLKRGW